MNCKRQRCCWNGQLNTGDCKCSIEQTNENLIQQLEEGRLNGLSNADAKYIAKRLQAFTGQDKIFRLVNTMLATSR